MAEGQRFCWLGLQIFLGVAFISQQMHVSVRRVENLGDGSASHTLFFQSASKCIMSETPD